MTQQWPWPLFEWVGSRKALKAACESPRAVAMAPGSLKSVEMRVVGTATVRGRELYRLDFEAGDRAMEAGRAKRRSKA
jgi:hypothetical protein